MNRPHGPIAVTSSQAVTREEWPLEVSVVMPCLNEADTVATCIRKARRALQEHGLEGEIIVADNGSTDGSVEMAAAEGARVVRVAERGYGHALMGGIAAARGRFIIMGDADDSYDFGEIPRIVAGLRQGAQLVQGCRLPSGGGTIRPAAMPFLHRWCGNPLLSWLARRMFGVPVHDVYCGLRGFTRELYDRLDLRCTGMEFATEMIIKASLYGEPIAEVPITLHPDGRKQGRSHLRTFRDGWRTLRLFLLYSPRWLFLVPGLLLIALGLLGYGLALPAATFAGITLDAHTLLVASLATLLGYQSVLFGVFSKTFAVRERLLPFDPRLARWLAWFRLERCLLLGAAAFLVGLGLIGVAWDQWRAIGFGRLDYARTMRWVIPGVTLASLGFQTILAGFLLSILDLGRK
ncbi:MAG: glycosyltransferase family 2 protein [Gemmataceae bacterium]|nr:glycosyltransferase family 2 protein [Gemmataceae bacterium]MDW8265140.1 glycosyltransferase family 2 protein [Gemmataceae bacterium]